MEAFEHTVDRENSKQIKQIISNIIQMRPILDLDVLFTHYSIITLAKATYLLQEH